MRKLKIPASELEVCARLREAREDILEMTQEGCAKQIGLDRSTLANYETGRTPLRFEIALRFCRQFIICEEWLATGKFEACHQAWNPEGTPVNHSWEALDDWVFKRQCVDLWSEHFSIRLKPGTPFNKAYLQEMAPRFAALVIKYLAIPRIRFNSQDDSTMVLNYLNVVNERSLLMLKSKHPIPDKPSIFWAAYAHCMLECSHLIYRKVKGWPLEPARLAEFAWLRELVTDPEATIPDQFFPELDQLKIVSKADPENISKKDLQTSSDIRKVDGVKSQIGELLKAVRPLVAPKGMKAKLAVYLDVPQSRVSEWLAGKYEPSGEMALRIRNWVSDPAERT